MGELLNELIKESKIEKENEELEIVKKYIGYGYHGGGRPKKADAEKAKYKTMAIAGTPEEIDEIKRLASESGKTISRYIIDLILNDN